jgi:hypothetical protein
LVLRRKRTGVEILGDGMAAWGDRYPPQSPNELRRYALIDRQIAARRFGLVHHRKGSKLTKLCWPNGSSGATESKICSPIRFRKSHCVEKLWGGLHARAWRNVFRQGSQVVEFLHFRERNFSTTSHDDVENAVRGRDSSSSSSNQEQTGLG